MHYLLVRTENAQSYKQEINVNIYDKQWDTTCTSAASFRYAFGCNEIEEFIPV